MASYPPSAPCYPGREGVAIVGGPIAGRELGKLAAVEVDGSQTGRSIRVMFNEAATRRLWTETGDGY